MVSDNANFFELKDGVYFSEAAREKFLDFENNYLSVREKEKRVLSDKEVKSLPYVDRNSVDYDLWKTRRKNIRRFLNYLSKKKSPLRILDIGCGNGFFTHMMSQNNAVIGVDVNLTELKQAATVFKEAPIKWYYLDILNEIIPESSFDIITFCASFQYFNNPKEVLDRCKSLLAEHGEIHIIDSPFYSPDKKETARSNSIAYYQKMKVEGMIDYYHHNTYEALTPFTYSFGYKPNKWKLKLIRDSPFPWLIIK